jgi:hypothetical protein
MFVFLAIFKYIKLFSTSAVIGLTLITLNLNESYHVF